MKIKINFNALKDDTNKKSSGNITNLNLFLLISFQEIKLLAHKS